MAVAALAPADAVLGLVAGEEPGRLLVAVTVRLVGENAHVDGGGVDAIVIQQRVARAPGPDLRVPRVLHEDVTIVHDNVEDVLCDEPEHGLLGVLPVESDDRVAGPAGLAPILAAWLKGSECRSECLIHMM